MSEQEDIEGLAGRFESKESRTATVTFKCNACGQTWTRSRAPSDSPTLKEGLGPSLANILVVIQMDHGEKCPQNSGKRIRDYSLTDGSVLTGVSFEDIKAQWGKYVDSVDKTGKLLSSKTSEA